MSLPLQYKNKAFIDIRLRPGIATPLYHASPYGPLHPSGFMDDVTFGPNVTSSIIPEVHNEAQGRPRRTEPQPQEIRTKIS